MKKILALMLSAGFMLPLAACGSNGGSLEEALVSEDWQAVMDYSTRPERTIVFREDGTGTMTSSNGYGGDILWEISDESTVDVEYSTNETVRNYTFEYTNEADSIRLTDHDQHMIFVPAENYESETEAVKAEMLESAQELDWESAYQIKLDNEAKFQEEYVGQIWKWTARVFEIGDGYCKMANEASSFGGANNAIYVYMSNSDLANLHDGDEITVVGIFDEYSDKLNNAFVVGGM